MTEPLVPDDFTVQTRLAILENVVRVCVERGATEEQIREAVRHALVTPECRSLSGGS